VIDGSLTFTREREKMRREVQTEQFCLLLMFVHSAWQKVCTSLLTNAF